MLLLKPCSAAAQRNTNSAQDELSASKPFISHIMRFVLTPWSLKRCFVAFVLVQLCLLATFGPRFYGHKLHQVHISLSDNDSISWNHWPTTHSTSLPSYTTTDVTQSTASSMIDIDREASLFIREYETICIEKRNATLDGFKLCPCLPRQLSEYNLFYGTCVLLGCIRTIWCPSQNF